jgi:CubicO group peptidase (beta-lactamase class C family)
MTDSGSNDPRGAAENIAIGYTHQLGVGGPDKARQRNTEILPARSSSAGGSYSTAADLLKLDIALRNDTLLPPEFGDWFFSDKQRAPGQRGPRSGGLGVAGGLPGGNATLEMDLDRGYSVIVLSNDDPPSATRVARKIREWIGI